MIPRLSGAGGTPVTGRVAMPFGRGSPSIGSPNALITRPSRPSPTGANNSVPVEITSVMLESPNRSPIGVSTATSSRIPITSAMTRRPVSGSTRWQSSPMRAPLAVAWMMTPRRRRTRPLRDRGALSRIFSYRLGRTEVRRSSILKRSAVIASRLVKRRRSRRRSRPVAF